MIAVITGDIINSRKVNADEWLPKLKEFLANTTNNHEKWEIYRGDSFQIQVEVNQALETALCIKALIKTNSLIDVRMSIGIGECTFQGENITESNGSAFIHSGEAFEKIKKNTLILKTPFDEIDEYFRNWLAKLEIYDFYAWFESIQTNCNPSGCVIQSDDEQ